MSQLPAGDAGQHLSNRPQAHAEAAETLSRVAANSGKREHWEGHLGDWGSKLEWNTGILHSWTQP